MVQYLPSMAGVAVLSVIVNIILMPHTHLMGLLDRPTDSEALEGTVPLGDGISVLTVVISSAAF